MPLQWPWKRGAQTTHIVNCENPCAYCQGPTYIQAHTDSDGNVEMFVVKCPKCGEIKRLYSKPRNVEMNLKLARKLAEKG